MSKMMGSYIDIRLKKLWTYIEEWQTTLYSLVVFTATMVVMFWGSVFLYTSFYFTYMPQESITWPIHLSYKSCGNQPGICSNPSSLISVLDPIRGSILARGQKYRVVVDLEMPESPTNQRLGMFLVTGDLISLSGESLHKSSRSTMLRYRSPMLQTISTGIFAPFLLYGIQEESQLITVELFSQYEEDPLNPLKEVSLELVSRHIEVYTAQLRIHAMFSGLRFFMYHYPLTSALVGIAICMIFLSSIVIFSWYQFTNSDTMQVSQTSKTYPIGPGMSTTGDSTTERASLYSSKDVSNLKINSEIGKQLGESSTSKTLKAEDIIHMEERKPMESQNKEELNENLRLGSSEYDPNFDFSFQVSEIGKPDSDEFEVVAANKSADEELSQFSSNGETVLRQRIQVAADNSPDTEE